jgi:Tol biopolymer transport system component
MKSKFFLSIVFLIVLIGCSSISTPPEIHSPPTIMSTSIIDNKITPAATAMKALNAAENWEAAKSCVTTYSARPDGYELTGIAVLRSLSSTTLSLSMSLLDLESSSSKEINTENQSVWDADVSPNRKTLGYLWFNNATSKWELPLIDAIGNQQKVAWSDEEFGFYGLLNDHLVVIEEGKTYTLVDLDKGSQAKIFPADFPDFDTDHPTLFFVSFNSVLTRAIYKNTNIILLDLSTNTIITLIKDTYDRVPIIAWESSGERVAVVATSASAGKISSWVKPDEIFIVDQNGQTQQLTHLYENFGLTSTIDSLSWSPDGEKIAFWLYDGHGNNTLMVTDSLTGKTINYCILNVTTDLFLIYLPAPIWSPDGQKLLVESRYAQDKSNLLVVDLKSHIAFHIAENQNPVGWMIKP